MPTVIEGSHYELRGTCAVCHVSLKRHQKCESCGVLAGPGHAVEELSEHQGKLVCGSCASKWEFLEDVAMSGYPVTLRQCIGADVGGRPRAKCAGLG